MRAYWYDGAYEPGHPNAAAQRRYHEAIAEVPGIQLRLGHPPESTPAWQHAVAQAVGRCGVADAAFAAHFDFRPERRQKGVDTPVVVSRNKDGVIHSADQGFQTSIIILGGCP